MKFILPLLIFTASCFSQESDRTIVLDSINKARENERGAFNLYIKKLNIEVIAGVFRNRESVQQGFEPVNFTYHLSLPFQFDLNYVNLKAKDKLLKLNTNLIIHHSKYGNYALGMGERFSFLVMKKIYLAYQVGVVWCEPVKKNTNDGITTMGFSLHHVFSLSYRLNKRFDVSANVVHISSGNLFGDVDNTQDVLGVGASYQF